LKIRLNVFRCFARKRHVCVSVPKECVSVYCTKGLYCRFIQYVRISGFVQYICLLLIVYCLYQKSVCKFTVLVCKAVRLAFSCRTSAISFPFIPVPWFCALEVFILGVLKIRYFEKVFWKLCILYPLKNNKLRSVYTCICFLVQGVPRNMKIDVYFWMSSSIYCI